MKQESKNYHNKDQRSPENGRLIRSFGRIKSRKLSDHKNSLLQELLPIYEIKDANFSSSKISLEIGFGFGDFLFEKAKNNPDILFLGSEPHLNGVVNLLAKLEKEPLKNLKISRQDIRILLNDFAPNFFDEVYILFPDPWPKVKHFKRRLINVEFLEKILSPKIKSGGKLVIATDHDLYKTWILSAILKNKNFVWTASEKKDWQVFPKDWVKTKYQKKAALEGRTSVIFNLINK